MLRISNSGGTSLSRGVSSMGGNSRAFGEFIEDDKNQLHTPPSLSTADESSPRERKEGGESQQQSLVTRTTGSKQEF